jgi:hypothetical protein
MGKMEKWFAIYRFLLSVSVDAITLYRCHFEEFSLWCIFNENRYNNHEISGFLYHIDEMCALLGYYAA